MPNAFQSAGAAMAPCKHSQWTFYDKGSGSRRMCTECGYSWTPVKKVWNKATLLPPKHYERRNTKAQVVSKNGYVTPCNWETCDWQSLYVKSWMVAELTIAKWNQESKLKGNGWEYKLPLHCDRCYTCVNETWATMGFVGMHVCSVCRDEGNGIWQQEKAMKAKATNPAATPLKMSIGSIWKLDTKNAPFQSEQWGYQGTSKSPYVITHYFNRVDGSTTQDGWACSCMSFTRNVPRTPCKHILNVMLKEGQTPKGATPKAAKLSALLTDEDAKAFQQWQREQAEKKEVKPSAGAELQLFGSTARKFR